MPALGRAPRTLPEAILSLLIPNGTVEGGVFDILLLSACQR
jgi:hypothetical protein